MLWRVGESLVKNVEAKQEMRRASPPGMNKSKSNARPRALQTHLKTKVGQLKRIGTNPWGKPLVACPQCGQPATAGKSGDVWCRACGFDTATLVGCT
jgi:hypothetical protein